nr:Hsp70 family protein [Phascolarctobacterium succinatutens]
MGHAHAEGLADEVMDKTPAQVSARILQHMLREASKIYRTEIKDAVITVPANFDSVMCQATRDAAALAGIQVTNKDGSERPVLLSEPNAVIYDLINQVQNGEISNHIIDLNSEKNVLVFDLGGGTLDITMHKIKRREDCPDVLKVDEIATNRYTLLGGDDFDRAIADVMFEHYQKQYSTSPMVVRKLQQEKKAIMPQLLNYAEELKLELSERQRADSGYAADDDFIWYDEEFPVGGNMGGIGYAYDDSFTQEDVEKILQPFMGQSLQFADYKKIDSLQDTKNIIYPILDVLQKSAAKLGDEVKVDAVIVNGGMSKFYMVINRLREFFGLEPIVALDPDQAVARGAAVYHYYLHKYAKQMQEDMRMVGAEAPALQPLPGKAAAPKAAAAAAQQRAAIEWGKNILNDSLYLGMRDGAVQELVAGGTDLPYQSDYIKGFQLLPDKAEIAIPIKRRTFGDTYQTIGNGHLKLKHGYKDGAYVAIRVLMGSNKVLSMEMLLSSDVDMHQILEQKTAEIVIGGDNPDAPATKLKFNPPAGTKLNVHNELHGLQTLCERKSTAKGNAQKDVINKLSQRTSSIAAAGNKAEFARPLLEMLCYTNNDELRLRLFTIARKHVAYWTEQQRQSLARECLNQLQGVLQGFPCYGLKINVNIQAIYTLGCCGSKEQVAKVQPLAAETRYYTASLYALGKSRVDGSFVQEVFQRDAYCESNKCNLQVTAHALGMALRLEDGGRAAGLDVDQAVKDLCFIINNRTVLDVNYSSEIVCCLIALAYACDQRFGGNTVSAASMELARQTLANLNRNYSAEVMMRLAKAAGVAYKMLDGESLSEDEEEFLLKKLEI